MFVLKFLFFFKSFQFKAALYSTPETWVYGYSSRTQKGKYVLFHDYDNLQKEDVIEELKALQARFRLSNYYLFQLAKNSFHAVCLDTFSLSEAFEIQKQTSSDSAFIHAPLNLGMREWVLRIGKKGDRKEPEFIETINSNFKLNVISTAHADFLKKYFGIKIGAGWIIDGCKKLNIVQYDTANRVKK